MMAGFFMKLLSMVPLAIAGLYILAGKALVRLRRWYRNVIANQSLQQIISKIALLLAGIIGLKKIVAQKNAGGQQGWSQGGGGGGGWERSIDSPIEAQNIAYRAHKQ